MPPSLLWKYKFDGTGFIFSSTGIATTDPFYRVSSCLMKLGFCDVALPKTHVKNRANSKYLFFIFITVLIS
jgi:hypothetical protein